MMKSTFGVVIFCISVATIYSFKMRGYNYRVNSLLSSDSSEDKDEDLKSMFKKFVKNYEKENAAFKKENAAFKKEDAAFKKEVTGTLNLYKPVWDKAGRTFEIAKMQQLRELDGAKYYRTITVRSLVELARASLPEDVVLAEESAILISKDPMELIMIRAKKLALAAQEQLTSLRVWVHAHSQGANTKEKSLLKKKSMDCLKYLQEYDAITEPDKKLRYLIFSPLGFYAFTRLAFTADYEKGYTPELEFDIAGSVKLADSFYSFECAEVKISGRQEVLDQLIIRMGIVWSAISILLSPEVDKYSIHFHGVAISDGRKWAPFSATDTREALKRCNLNLPDKYVSIGIRV